MQEKKLQNTLKDIKLVNHACFSFYHGDAGCLVDPWFEGSIFNNSWKLVSEGGQAPDNLKYIFISHEHPDHLHWPTLSKLASSEVTVVLCQRNNDNVEINLKRLGYNVLLLPNQTKHNLDGLTVEFFRSGHDHAIVFEQNGFVMVNQNDCQLQESTARALKDKYPEIDVWWMQFSLAGYYGNLDDKQKLVDAQKQHKNMFSSYQAILQPRISVPFASFVNFCREENKELNDYRVRLEDILEDNSGVQILYNGDSLLDSDYEVRNLSNVRKWEESFEASIELETPTSSREEFEEVFREFCSKHPAQGQLQFELFDDVGCVLNMAEGSCEFKKPAAPIAKVHLFDLREMFKNPWGADTLNITSCFHVYNEEAWRYLLLAVDSLYTR